MEDLKIKPLDKDKILLSIDRLTRFKNPEEKYLRVFYDLITQNLITPKYKKSDLDKMDYSLIKNIAQEILNVSIQNLSADFNNEKDFTINKKLYEYEISSFETENNVKELLDNRIEYKKVLPFIDDSSVKNLRWLKELNSNKDIKQVREKKSLRFPVEKIVIVEGATEEILLPEFGKLCGYDFDKNGVYILPAGGKNQVVKMFYKYCEISKLPIFVLLDKDASNNLEEITPKLREKDKIHLLNCGEFEDLLPVKLIKKTLESELKNISELDKNILNEDTPKVQFLEETFKNRGMHEFKKVEFAQMVKQNINSKNYLTPEIIEIIEQIKNI